MRRFLLFLCVCAVARVGASASAPVIDVSLPLTRTTGTNTLTRCSGYVENIQIFATDGFSTGTVQLIALPLDGIGASVDIVAATACSNAPRVFRPRVDGTTTVGAANTSDPPERFYLYTQTLRLLVYDATSNRTWRARIKLSDY